MNPSTLAYFSDYELQLGMIKSPNQVYANMASWIWSNRGRAAGVANDVNNSLNLKGRHAFQAHIPTLAVGHVEEMVIVSANPGYSSISNQAENTYRSSSIGNNEQFCSDFFNTYPMVTSKRSMWWTKALGFAHLIQMHTLQPDTRLRWAWAQNRPLAAKGGISGVANFDLIPLHSTSDGFRLMSGSSPANSLLRSIAVATLRMIVNLNPAPRLIFIASSAGMNLLKIHHQSFGLTPVFHPAPLSINAYLQTYRHGASGRTVVTFGRQMFAGNFAMNTPAGYTPQLLANFLRPLANPTY